MADSDAPTQDAAPQDAPPQDAPPQDAPPQDAAPQDAAPQQAPSGTPAVTDANTRLINSLASEVSVANNIITTLRDNNRELNDQISTLITDNEKCMRDKETEVKSAEESSATIWKSFNSNSIRTLTDLCNSYKTNILNSTSESNIQRITSIGGIEIGKMCSVGNNNVAIYNFNELDRSTIKNDNLFNSSDANASVVEYCNPSANNKNSYQEKLCVCNQLGPNPVLNVAYSKKGGAFGVNTIDVPTGFYCSAP